MKTITKLFALMSMLMLISVAANAQIPVSADATAHALIIAPIAITKTVDMDFGNMAVSNTTGGVVTLTPASVRSTPTGSGVTLPTGVLAGTVTAAEFTVDGESGNTYAITLPTTDHLIYNGTETMVVNNFTSTPSGTGLLTGGTETLTVGADLTVTAAQAPGDYLSSGTGFSVLVNYN